MRISFLAIIVELRQNFVIKNVISQSFGRLDLARSFGLRLVNCVVIRLSHFIFDLQLKEENLLRNFIYIKYDNNFFIILLIDNWLFLFKEGKSKSLLILCASYKYWPVVTFFWHDNTPLSNHWPTLIITSNAWD